MLMQDARWISGMYDGSSFLLLGMQFYTFLMTWCGIQRRGRLAVWAPIGPAKIVGVTAHAVKGYYKLLYNRMCL